MNKIWIWLIIFLVLAVAFWIWHKRFHAMVFFKSYDKLKEQVTFIFQGKDFMLGKGEGIMANGYSIIANFENGTAEVTISKAGKIINKQKYTC